MGHCGTQYKNRLRRVGTVVAIPWSNRVFCAAVMTMLCMIVVAGCSRDHDPCRNVKYEPYSADTLIGDLYGICYDDTMDCEECVVDVLLYLDTINLPSQNANANRIVLSSLPTDPGAHSDRLEFVFDGGSLPEEIDPTIIHQHGWKVQAAGAGIGYCKTCDTNCGLVPIIYLRGDVSILEFVHDPLDTLAIYIEMTMP